MYLEEYILKDWAIVRTTKEQTVGYGTRIKSGSILFLTLQWESGYTKTSNTNIPAPIYNDSDIHFNTRDINFYQCEVIKTWYRISGVHALSFLKKEAKKLKLEE